jgi:2',3'-cyclic-nucleotide 2'-phosphodiesterase (5'-nucleotidase family)
MQLIATTDFFGSFWPHQTSYGWLPGAHSLIDTIARIRSRDPATIWIDTGDFAQGGPFAPLGTPTTVFEEVGRYLPIDVASVGNHELDWGVDGLRAGLRHLGFPLICANADLGLEATTILATSDGGVGVIGLTTPALAELHAWFTQTQPDAMETVLQHAERLRRAGARQVVVALHDGVDFTFGAGGIRPDIARMAAFCRRIKGAVDAVVGGHTLGRWVGEIEGVAFVQPWAFSAEIGVA